LSEEELRVESQKLKAGSMKQRVENRAQGFLALGRFFVG
jgi:hypothetical protein